MKIILFIIIFILNLTKCQEVELKGGAGVKSEFLTFDGLSYQFNGYGEYKLFELKNGLLISQIRMTQLKNSKGENILASAITALAIKTQDVDSIQIELNKNNKQFFDVFVNGELFNKKNRLKGINLEFYKNGIFIEYSNLGIGFDIKLSKRHDSFMILVAIPNNSEFRSKTRGLLGVMDDDISNDLTIPFDMILNIDSSNDKEIFIFGQQWKINENESIFKYFNSNTYSSFNKKNFLPKFLSDGITFYNNFPLANNAVDYCKDNNYNIDKCLFEISVAGELGFIGADFEEEYLDEDKQTRIFKWLWNKLKESILNTGLNLLFTWIG